MLSNANTVRCSLMKWNWIVVNNLRERVLVLIHGSVSTYIEIIHSIGVGQCLVHGIQYTVEQSTQFYIVHSTQQYMVHYTVVHGSWQYVESTQQYVVWGSIWQMVVICSMGQYMVDGRGVRCQIFTFYGFLPASATKHLRLPNTNHPNRVKTPHTV